MKKESTPLKVGEAIGIDLSDRTAQYCHVSEAGEIKAEGRISLTREALEKAFGKMSRTRMAIETGAQSRWVKRHLQSLGTQKGRKDERGQIG